MAPVMLEPPDATEATDDAPGRWAITAEPGRVGLAYRGNDGPPEDQHVVPLDVVDVFKHGECRALGPDYVFGWARESPRQYRFVIHAEGTARRSELVAPRAGEMFAATRTRALVAMGNDTEVWEVAAADGHARKLLTLREAGDVCNLALLESGHAIVVGGESIHVVAPDGGARRFAINANDVAVDHGRVVVFEGMNDPVGAWVLALDGDVPRVLAAFEAPIDELKWHAGDVWLAVDDEWYTLTGLEAALANLARFPEAPTADDGGVG